MCVSTAPARLRNTITYAAEVEFRGRRVHVMGYQNRAQNQARGPNAMILPIPAGAPLGPDNCIDTSSFPRVLRDMVDHYRPRMRMLSLSKGGAQVFDSGMYTVVLVSRPGDLWDGLMQVPTNKRPTLASNMVGFYAKHYAGWHLAICCFDSRQELEPDPLLWWYEPLDENFLFAPAVDAHDGNPPNLAHSVKRDHETLWASDRRPHESVIFAHAHYPFLDAVPAELRALFPVNVWHAPVYNVTPNVDFVLPIDKLNPDERFQYRDFVAGAR